MHFIHFFLHRVFISFRIYDESKERKNINCVLIWRNFLWKGNTVVRTRVSFFPSRQSRSHRRQFLSMTLRDVSALFSPGRLIRDACIHTVSRRRFIVVITKWTARFRILLLASHLLPSATQTSISDFARDSFPFSAGYPPGLWIASSAPCSPMPTLRSDDAYRSLHGSSTHGWQGFTMSGYEIVCYIYWKAKMDAGFVRHRDSEIFSVHEI